MTSELKSHSRIKCSHTRQLDVGAERIQMIILPAQVENSNHHLRPVVGKTVPAKNIFLAKIVPSQSRGIPAIMLMVPIRFHARKKPRGVIEQEVSAGLVEVHVMFLFCRRQHRDGYLRQYIS